MPQSLIKSPIGVVLVLAPFAFAFQADQPAVEAGSAQGVTNPQPISRAEPKYTPEAKAARIQGKVWLSIVVGPDGIPKNIHVLRPLGYGLDEEAVATVKQWRFRPGAKDGKPVNVMAQVEITFRLLNRDGTTTARQQRYDSILNAVRNGNHGRPVIEALRTLASEKDPVGLYWYGKAILEGWGMAPDQKKGFRLIEESSDKHYGPALYDVAMARLRGTFLEKDPAKAIELMHSAAHLGSTDAQWFLGEAYRKGDGVPMDAERSHENYLLCATAGDANCELALAKSLLQDAASNSAAWLEAIAYLQLAVDRGSADANTLLDQQATGLTTAQIARIKSLKSQLGPQ